MESDERFEEKLRKNLEYIRKEVDVAANIEKDLAKLRDPLVHASIIYTLVRERESTNLILKNIYARLDALEERLKATERARQVRPVLSARDRKILAFVKLKKAVCAEDVRRKFRYRGRNAACARLNSLCRAGFLKKERVGKQVIYAYEPQGDQ